MKSNNNGETYIWKLQSMPMLGVDFHGKAEIKNDEK